MPSVTRVGLIPSTEGLLFSCFGVLTLRPHGLQHARLPCPSPSPGACSTHVHWFNHLILCRPRLLLPWIFPSIRVFSNESALRIRWPKYWSFSYSISPSSEYSGLISFRIDWLDLLGVLTGTKTWFSLKSERKSPTWETFMLGHWLFTAFWVELKQGLFLNPKPAGLWTGSVPLSSVSSQASGWVRAPLAFLGLQLADSTSGHGTCQPS